MTDNGIGGRSADEILATGSSALRITVIRPAPFGAEWSDPEVRRQFYANVKRDYEAGNIIHYITLRPLTRWQRFLRWIGL